VHWWRRILRVIKMEKVYLRDGQDSVDHILGEVSEDDYELRKEAAEYVIPPRWLHEFKKRTLLPFSCPHVVCACVLCACVC
jgi:hypothetical protein